MTTLLRPPAEAEAVVTTALGPSGWITTATRARPVAPAPDSPPVVRLTLLAHRLLVAAEELGGDRGRQLRYAAGDMHTAVRLTDGDATEPGPMAGTFLASAAAYVDQAERTP